MATITFNTAANNAQEVTIPANNLSGDDVTIGITTFSGQGGTIAWGDGNSDSFISAVDITHTLTSDITDLKISLINGLEDLQAFRTFINPLKIIGDLNPFKLFTNIENISLSESYFSIPISSLPSTLKILFLEGDLQGNVSGLPSNLINLATINSLNYDLIGNINDFSSALFNLNLSKSSIDGNIDNLSDSLTSFSLNDNNQSISGNILNLKNRLIDFFLVSPNAITGNISNIKSNLNQLSIKGGSNTVTGSLNTLPIGLKTLILEGFNTVGGSLHTTSTELSSLILKGNNSVNNAGNKDYTVFNNGYIKIELNPSSLLLTPIQVDQLLIDLNNGITNANGVIIDLIGQGGVRTAASDAAFNNLVANGATITITT